VGKGSATQRQVAAGAARVCAERGCDAVLLLGDNLYPRGMEADDDPRMDAWIGETYRGLGAPVYLVVGNHDYGHGRDKARAAREIAWADRTPGFEFPANAWVADAGPARIIGLDTNAMFQFGARFQGQWLHDRLAESDARWKIVVGHHPYRSEGPHGNAGTYDDTRLVPFVSGGELREVFDRELCGAVDLYAAGHDHSRQLLEWCGTSLIVSGAGASATPIVGHGNRVSFAEGSPGGVWVEVGDVDGRVAFFDADGFWQSEFPIAPTSR
ncbi:MAG: metallophosphoesterase, partial [Myxococcota bacterium]